MVKDSDDREEHGEARLNERPSIGFPSGGFARSLDASDASCNARSALESDRRLLHRHLEGSDGSKPSGRVLSGKQNRRRSRVRINQSRNSESVSPTVTWSRRRRSVGCGLTHAVHERFADTHRRAHTRSHAEQVHAHARTDAQAHASTHFAVINLPFGGSSV